MRRRQFFGACARAGATVAAASAAGAAVSAATCFADSDAAQATANAAPPFKLSVMLWTVYEKLPFDQRLEKVAEAGYHAVELVNEYKNFSKEDYAKFRAKKRELNLTVDATSGISHSLCDSSQRDAFLDEVRAKLPVLEELECNKLIILSGDKVPGQSPQQMHENCIEGLKRAADIAAAKNVGILLENIDPEENPKYFLTSVSEGFEIVRSVGAPNLQFLYDFFHDQIAEGNLLAKLEKNLDLIGVVHIADVPGRHDPGTGEINYPNIFRKLGQLGFNGYVAMEFIPEGETVAALRAAREMAMKYGSAQRNQSAQFISPGGPMQRRELFRLLGAGAALPVFDSNLLAAFQDAHPKSTYTLRTLNPHQNATLVTMTDLIIPETDTPGAKAVRVNEFIDLILTEWAHEDERKTFLAGLDDVDRRSNAIFGKNFIDVTPAEQEILLRELDQRYAMDREDRAAHPFVRRAHNAAYR